MTWPVQPLLDLPGVTNRDIAKALRTSGTTWHRLRVNGLNDWQADRAAIRLGTVPHLVWPGWVDAGMSPLDQMFIAGGWRQAWLHMETAA
jgi:hypothetical protein